METSQHQNQPCCLDNGSCPRYPRHPQGQLVSVGEGFHGGGPEGVHQGLGKNKGQQDLSPLSGAHWVFVSVWLSLTDGARSMVGEANMV